MVDFGKLLKDSKLKEVEKQNEVNDKYTEVTGEDIPEEFIGKSYKEIEEILVTNSYNVDTLKYMLAIAERSRIKNKDFQVGDRVFIRGTLPDAIIKQNNFDVNYKNYTHLVVYVTKLNDNRYVMLKVHGKSIDNRHEDSRRVVIETTNTVFNIMVPVESLEGQIGSISVNCKEEKT